MMMTSAVVVVVWRQSQSELLVYLENGLTLNRQILYGHRPTLRHLLLPGGCKMQSNTAHKNAKTGADGKGSNNLATL